MLEQIRLDEHEHRVFVRTQRQSYWSRRGMAEDKLQRADVFSIILDGADINQFCLPYFPHVSHSTMGAWRVQTHLMGAICHGRGAWGYVFLDNFKHGSNITIEALHHVMVDVWKVEGKLPKIAYVQLDNTSKQCKNQYVLGWLACLVLWGVFEEIVITYLPVGHTHEDIDQFFSRLAVYLRHHAAHCRQTLAAAVKACFTCKDKSKPTTGILETCANISHWLDPILNTMVPVVRKSYTRHGVFGYHQFRFRRTADGRNVNMQVKTWARDTEDWRGLIVGSNSHTMFKRSPTLNDLRDSVPPQQTKDIEPKDGKTVEETRLKINARIRSGVAKCIASRAVSPACQADLEACLTLVEKIGEPVPFQWDLSMYDALTTLPRYKLRSPMELALGNVNAEVDAAEAPANDVAAVLGDGLGADADLEDEKVDDLAPVEAGIDFEIGDMLVVFPEDAELRFALGVAKSGVSANANGHMWFHVRTCTHHTKVCQIECETS